MDVNTQNGPLTYPLDFGQIALDSTAETRSREGRAAILLQDVAIMFFDHANARADVVGERLDRHAVLEGERAVRVAQGVIGALQLGALQRLGAQFQP